MQRFVFFVALASTATLLGCGKAGSDLKKSVATAKERPADSGISKPATVQEIAPARLVIQVFQEDSNRGVAAQVSRLDDTGAAHFVVDVDDSGVARLPQPCTAEDRFAANPIVAAFLRVAPQPCAPTVTFRLYSAQTTYELIRVAENAEKAGNFSVAQANYGLAAERLQYSKPPEADKLKMLASRNVGKILGVDQPTVVVNGKSTLAPGMENKVREYQKKARIPVTGEIDPKTREALSREKVTTTLH